MCEVLMFKVCLACLQGGGVPWKEHLFDLEKELQVDTPVL
jgi:hypothetical protein